jgi:hypothetical protein
MPDCHNSDHAMIHSILDRREQVTIGPDHEFVLRRAITSPDLSEVKNTKKAQLRHR